MRGLLASRLRGFLASLNQRIDAMATAMFDSALSPARRDTAARDEFTAEFSAGLDMTVHRHSVHRNRRHHPEW